MIAAFPAQWTPLALDAVSGQEPSLEWVFTGQRRFVEPFWEQTIEKCLNQPFASAFLQRTTLSEVDALAAGRGAALPPLGFVFHVSRCGSTLVSRLLSTLPQVRVLSEAGPLDAALRVREQRPDVSEDEHRQIIRSVWSAMALRRSGEERGVVVKWDAWNTASAALLRSVFPDVPAVFVYRDPLEVLASHRSSPGQHMVPGMLPPGLLGIPAGALPDMPFDLYQAHVLRSFYAAGLAQFAPDELVSYEELPDAIWTRLLGRFGIETAPGQDAVLREQAGFSAKNPALSFESDRAAKQAMAREHIAPDIAALLVPLYEALESRRASTPG